MFASGMSLFLSILNAVMDESLSESDTSASDTDTSDRRYLGGRRSSLKRRAIRCPRDDDSDSELNDNMPGSPITPRASSNLVLHGLSSAQCDLTRLMDAYEDEEQQRRKRRRSCVSTLLDLAAEVVAKSCSCEDLEYSSPPLDESLLRKVAYWAFPTNEAKVKAYASMTDQFRAWTRGQGLVKDGRVKEMWQVGFMATAHLAKYGREDSNSSDIRVSLVFEKQRIVSSTCSECKSDIWCAHVVAAVIFRMQCPEKVRVHAPMTETLSTLDRNQLQKVLQYAVQEDPAGILGKVFKHIDSVRDNNSQMNRMEGAPDPTFGGLQLEKSHWQLSVEVMEKSLQKNLSSLTAGPIFWIDSSSNSRNKYYPDCYDLTKKQHAHMLFYNSRVIELVRNEEYEHAAQVLVTVLRNVISKLKEVSEISGRSLRRYFHDLCRFYALTMLHIQTRDRKAWGYLKNTAIELNRVPGLNQYKLRTSAWAEVPSLASSLLTQSLEDTEALYEPIAATQIVAPPPSYYEFLRCTAPELSPYEEPIPVMFARLQAIYYFEKNQPAYTQKIMLLSLKLLDLLSRHAKKYSIIGEYLAQTNQEGLHKDKALSFLGRKLSGKPETDSLAEVSPSVACSSQNCASNTLLKCESSPVASIESTRVLSKDNGDFIVHRTRDSPGLSQQSPICSDSDDSLLDQSAIALNSSFPQESRFYPGDSRTSRRSLPDPIDLSKIEVDTGATSGHKKPQRKYKRLVRKSLAQFRSGDVNMIEDADDNTSLNSNRAGQSKPETGNSSQGAGGEVEGPSEPAVSGDKKAPGSPVDESQPGPSGLAQNSTLVSNEANEMKTATECPNCASKRSCRRRKKFGSPAPLLRSPIKTRAKRARLDTETPEPTLPRPKPQKKGSGKRKGKGQPGKGPSKGKLPAKRGRSRVQEEEEELPYLSEGQLAHGLMYSLYLVMKCERKLDVRLWDDELLLGYLLLALEVSSHRTFAKKEAIQASEQDWLWRLEHFMSEYLQKKFTPSSVAVHVYFQAFRKVGLSYYRGTYPLVLMDNLASMVALRGDLQHQCSSKNHLITLLGDLLKHIPASLDKYTLPVTSKFGHILDHLESHKNVHRDFIMYKVHSLVGTLLSQIQPDKPQHEDLLVEVLSNMKSLNSAVLLNLLVKDFKLQLFKMKNNRRIMEMLLQFTIQAFCQTRCVQLPKDSVLRDHDFLFSLAYDIGIDSLKFFAEDWKSLFSAKDIKDLIFLFEAQIREMKKPPEDVVKLVLKVLRSNYSCGTEVCDLLSFFKPGDSNYKQSVQMILQNRASYDTGAMFAVAQYHWENRKNKICRILDSETFDLLEAAMKQIQIKGAPPGEHIDWLFKTCSGNSTVKDMHKNTQFLKMIELVTLHATSAPDVLLRILQNVEKSPGLLKLVDSVTQALVGSYVDHFSNKIFSCSHSSYTSVINEMLRARLDCKHYLKDGEKQFNERVVCILKTLHKSKKKFIRMLDEEFLTARMERAKP